MRPDNDDLLDIWASAVILVANLAAMVLIIVRGRPWATPLLAPNWMCGQHLCSPPSPPTVSPTGAAHLVALAVGATATTVLAILIQQALRRRSHGRGSAGKHTTGKQPK